MSGDEEDLLREGLDRLAADTRVPGDILARARMRVRRRKIAARTVLACGTVAITVAAVISAIGGSAGPGTGGVTNMQTTAYVIQRVERALASQNLVYHGLTTDNGAVTSTTWAYGPHNRFEEYWPTADHRDRVVNGQRLWDFPPNLRGQPYLTQGTAHVGGKLTFAYITYFDHRYSLSPLPGSLPQNACSTTAALAAVTIPTNHWSNFIQTTLACGAATVTGHVQIDGVQTLKITGVPVTVKLPLGYAKTVHEKWAQARWTLYVNPKTYLPVRMFGSTRTFGGTAGSTFYSTVTNVSWLSAVPANIAKAVVTIPPGYTQANSPPSQ